MTLPLLENLFMHEFKVFCRVEQSVITSIDLSSKVKGEFTGILIWHCFGVIGVRVYLLGNYDISYISIFAHGGGYAKHNERSRFPPFSESMRHQAGEHWPH